MAKRYAELNDKLIEFIRAQKIYFVGTAAATGNVNVSPKGMDSLLVMSPNRVLWLNVTGSGNESAAHILLNPRMTLMFCAFEGTPLILRLYGSAKAIHQADAQWQEMLAQFPPIPGPRQIVDLTIDMVQTSCGMAVPFFEYQDERQQLNDLALKIGEDGLREYREAKNQFSIDGFPTLIVEKSSPA